MGFEIINKLKKEKGLTNAQISKLSGVTLSTLDKITSGANKNPKLDTLQAICRVLGCTLDDFSEKSSISGSLSLEEKEFIKNYRALTSEGKSAIDSLIKTLLAMQATSEQTTTEQPPAETPLITGDK